MSGSGSAILPPCPSAISSSSLWVSKAVSWFAASFWSARTEKQVPTAEVWIYRTAITVGAILLWHRTGDRLGATRLFHVSYSGACILAALTFLGIAFAWWARIHLGRLWSGAVTRKEGHRVIDTGPYRLVRHPIYTGLGLATIATAAVVSTWPAILRQRPHPLRHDGEGPPGGTLPLRRTRRRSLRCLSRACPDDGALPPYR